MPGGDRLRGSAGGGETKKSKFEQSLRSKKGHTSLSKKKSQKGKTRTFPAASLTNTRYSRDGLVP